MFVVHIVHPQGRWVWHIMKFSNTSI